MTKIYKGYQLTPSSEQIKDSNKWTTMIDITKVTDRDASSQPFHIDQEFDTKEEADSYSYFTAQQIIDGKHSTIKLDF
jgi:hypothetical protein